MRIYAWLLLVLAPAMAVAADLGQPINTICPVDGMMVDTTRDPIVVSDSTGRNTELVALGVCSHDTCAEAVRRDPEAYLDAARRDGIARIDDRGRGRDTAWDDVDQSPVTTDATSRGKPADPDDRPLLNDRPNALGLKHQFEHLGKSAEQIEGDRMETKDRNERAKRQ